MARRIIALCGYPGVGKDSVAKALVGFTRVAFADPMRDALMAIDPWVRDEIGFEKLSVIVSRQGWDSAKRCYPEIRALLQHMGTEAGRMIHGQDCWVRIAMSRIHQVRGDAIVTDLRFENEYQALKKCCGLTVVHITRPGYGPVNSHVSELLDYAAIADTTLVNDGPIDRLRIAAIGRLQ
jgi:hypothetical protein